LYYFSVWPNNSDTVLYERPESGILSNPFVSIAFGITIILIITLINIVLHEGLHGVVFYAFCKGKWKDNIKFGVIWDQLTPYCTCKKPLTASGYLLGGLTPFLVLGIGIYFVSLYFGLRELMYLGLLNILWSGGDLLIALLLIIYRPKYALDHPSQCGFIGIFAPKDKNRTIQ
jgi:hypothetical protein